MSETKRGKKKKRGAWEVAQWLRALNDLSEVLGSIPRAYGGPQPSITVPPWDLMLSSYIQTYM